MRSTWRALASALGGLVLVWGPVAAPAQGAAPGATGGLVTSDGTGFSLGRPVTPIVTLDREQLFSASAFGRRVAQQLAAASEQLSRENRAIEAELQAEERALTEQRPTLPPDEFRALADAFDDKAVGFRRAQDTKARALARREEAERQIFFRASLPILADLMSEIGAVAMLDDRAVLLSSEGIDITTAAIARIDAEIGDGVELSPQGPIFPEPGPDVPAMPGSGSGGAADALPGDDPDDAPEE